MVPSPVHPHPWERLLRVGSTKLTSDNVTVEFLTARTSKLSAASVPLPWLARQAILPSPSGDVHQSRAAQRTRPPAGSRLQWLPHNGAPSVKADGCLISRHVFAVLNLKGESELLPNRGRRRRRGNQPYRRARLRRRPDVPEQHTPRYARRSKRPPIRTECGMMNLARISGEISRNSPVAAFHSSIPDDSNAPANRHPD